MTTDSGSSLLGSKDKGESGGIRTQLPALLAFGLAIGWLPGVTLSLVRAGARGHHTWNLGSGVLG